MRILIVLTYFQPHKSGLTVYAVRQARALVGLGHDVTVLTSQYDQSLPQEEWDQGVRIIRLPVAFRLSKGVIMPSMPFKVFQLIGDSDVVNLHVPQVDAALVALLAKIRRKPVVLTYHCDLKMPEGVINQLAGKAAHLANRISATLSDVIVHNTRDFAEHSAFLQGYLDKLKVIQPPILISPTSEESIVAFREKYGINKEQQIIGMVARLATEKGVEYLVQAMPMVLTSRPDARTVFVGEYKNVFGEEAYKQKLIPMIQQLGTHWTFLGVVSEMEKAIFYRVCDVLVLPSINSTESFGMVQVEAMISGTRVIASDLPGVRQPVQNSGLGQTVPPGDVQALARAIIEELSSKKRVPVEKISDLRRYYSPLTVAKAYVDLYQQLLRANGQQKSG